MFSVAGRVSGRSRLRGFNDLDGCTGSLGVGDGMEGLGFFVCIILLNNSDPVEAGPISCIFIHKGIEMEEVLRPPQG